MEKKWMPKIEEKYYCINSNDEGIDNWPYYDCDADKYRIKLGNCFKTEKEAKFELEKINFIAKMKEDFEPWKCDWDNVNEKKYSLVYYFDGKITKKKWDFSYKTQGAIYTTNEEMIKKYVNNPDTIKYLFRIEPVEKKYIIELNTNSGILYIDCNREEVIKELKFTNKKENATIFGNDDANYVSSFYLALKKIEVENEEEIIEIKE